MGCRVSSDPAKLAQATWLRQPLVHLGLSYLKVVDARAIVHTSHVLHQQVEPGSSLALDVQSHHAVALQHSLGDLWIQGQVRLNQGRKEEWQREAAGSSTSSPYSVIGLVRTMVTALSSCPWGGGHEVHPSLLPTQEYWQPQLRQSLTWGAWMRMLFLFCRDRIHRQGS